MKRDVILACVYLFAVKCVLAEARPVVRILSNEVSAEAAQLLQEHFEGTIFREEVSGPRLDPGELIARLEDLSVDASSKTDLFLLGCKPGKDGPENDEEQIRKILEIARIKGINLLWMDNAVPAGQENADRAARLREFNTHAMRVMKEEGVHTISFSGFSAKPLRRGCTVPQAVADYLGEARGEWWWTFSNNPKVPRVKLWPGTPPEYKEMGVEGINAAGRVSPVTVPEIVQYQSSVKAEGAALIYFSGGGYGQLSLFWNVNSLGEKLSAEGITLFALKYRTGRGHSVPLLDAQRAVRWVRYHAAEYNVDPDRIGVAGTSAGANLVLSLLSWGQPGDPKAEDPVDRMDSRPDYAVVLTSWHQGSTESPFEFPPGTPPVLLRHAKDDKSFPLAQKVVEQLQAGGVPVSYSYLEKGGHGAFNQRPDSVGRNWTNDFIPWLRQLGLYQQKIPQAGPDQESEKFPSE